jgi:hypothetical protein
MYVTWLYRGHCVPLVCGWGKRGLWVSWIPDLYSSCLASFLVLFFSLLLAVVFGVCSNPSVWRFRVASVFAVECLWCIPILLVAGGSMYSLLLLLLAGVMMCVHTYVCGVSAVVLLTCAEVFSF